MIGANPIAAVCVALALGLETAAVAQTTPDSLVAFDGRRLSVERTELPRRHAIGTDTITLAVTYLRIPAATPTPGSPIVFLMGGPGVPASVIARVPPYFTLFDQLRATADVILLDQRGTGLSRPSLGCEPRAPPPPTLLATAEQLATALAATYRPCVDAWRESGAPPEIITVAAIADDVEAIRAALGAPRISLLGFSYGTRLALEYAARYPDRVDLVALQGVLGFEHGVRLPTTLDHLLDRVSALAAEDSVARSLVPDLRAALAARLRDLDARPLLVPVPAAPDDTVQLTVGAGGFRALVTGQLADPRLPALLATLERGDTRVLAQMIAPIYRDLAAGGGSVFGRAAYCSAPPSPARQARARALAADALLGEIFDNVTVSPAFCRAMGMAPGAASSPPSRLGGRALLIEGTLDDRTPLGNAQDLAPLFSAAVIVTVENGGHELLPAPDVQDLVVGFFQSQRPVVATMQWRAPSFMTIEQALQPRRRPGG